MTRRIFRKRSADAITERDGQSSERGDTLIEVLFAIVILGIAGGALLTAFATSITSSAQHRQLATEDASVRAASAEVIAQVQDATDKAFTACPTPYSPTWNLTGSSKVTSYNVQYWTGTAFSPASPTGGCPAGGVATNPQLWTMTISSGTYQTTVSTVIYDPQPLTPTAGTTPAKLIFLAPTTSSPGSGTINGPVNPQPIVAIEDTANNIVYSDASSVTLTATGGTGSLSNNCSGVENNGIFSFSNCSFSATGTYTVTAKDSNSAVSTTSASYAVSTAVQAKIAITTAAISSVATPSPTLGKITVQVEDAFNNPDPGGAVTVNLSSSSSTGVFAATSGGSAITSVTIPAGQSTASFYYGDSTAGSPIITASSSGLASSVQTETITPGPENKLAITTAPPSSFAAGASFSVGVTVEDQYGNPITTGYTGSTDSIKIALSTGKFSSGSSTMTATAANGVATFSNLAINAAGAYTITATDTSHTSVTAATASFTVTAAPPSKFAFTQTVSGNHTVGTTASVGPFQVQVQDQFGNVIANTGGPVTVLLSSSSSGSTFVTPTSGGASAAAVTIATGASSSPSFYYADTSSGSPTLTASAIVNGASVSGTTSGFTMTPTAESQLALTTQPPASLAAGSTFSVGVTVEDQYGNPITTGNIGSTDTVKLTLSSGSFATGTTSLAATNGVASFSGLSITTPGSYTIAASDTTHTAITTASTSPFVVTTAPPSKLVVSTQPSGSITAGGAVSVGVTIEDQYGNVITTGNTGSTDTIHVALSSGSFASGTTSAAATNGVATFSGLQITNAGNLTITASDTSRTGVTTATTNQITVAPGPENKLAVTTQPPSSLAAGTTFSVGVTIQDQFGNTITTGNTGSNDSIHLALSSGSFAGGTTTVTATNGVASFSGLQINTAGTYTITASDSTTGSVTAAATNQFTVNPAAENKLVVTTQPAGTIAAGGTVTVGVTVEDQYGNTITTGTTGSNDTIHVALSSGSFAAGTTSVPATNGVSSFSGLQITATAGSPYTITASDTTHPSVTSATTNQITVTPAAENKLVVTTQPAGTITAGGTVTVGVTVEDQYGNTITTGNTGSNDTLHVALSSGSFAAGTTSVPASNGVASFGGLQINAAGTYTITASDSTTGSVTSTATNSFTVNPAAENKLVISTQPTGTITAGATVTVGVTIEDQFGNTITTGTTGSNDTIHVALSSGSFAAGTTSVAATNGVASFSGLQITSTAGSPYTITASDSSHGTVTSTTTNNITVNPASATTLAFTSSPSGNFTVGTTASVGQFRVQVQDQYGNPVTNGGSAVTVLLSSNSSGATIFTPTSGGTSNGVVTIAGGSSTSAPFYYADTHVGSPTISASATVNASPVAGTTNGFAMTPAAENKLAVTTQPASPVAAGGTVTVGVTVEDQYGNTITTGTTGSNDTLHVALSSGGFAGGTTTVAATNGVASFSGLQINTAGTYTITASDSTTGSVTATATNSFTVNPAAENKLVVTTQPAGTITAGGTVTVGVTVEDQYGNTITTGNTGSNDTLHVALSSGGFASGTTSVAATNGVASFSGLQITSVAGSPYTITASDTTHGTVTSATTNNITVNPAAENKLAVTTQPPASVAAGSTFSVGVTVEDQYGNVITTGNTGSTDTIHVALSSGSFASGTTSVAAANGVATISGLSITPVGSYTITASDSTAPSVTASVTTSVSVTPAGESKLVVTTQPAGTITAGGTVSVGVTVEDQYGNVITTGNTGSTDTIHVALSSGGFAAGTTSVGATNGVASFSGLQITSAGSLTITASDTTHPSVASATTNSITVNAGAENKLAVTAQPTSFTAGGGAGLGVTVEDQYGNPITTGTGSSDTLHVTLSSGGFVTGTTTVAASGGSASFSGLQINSAGTYSITASDTTNGSVTAATTNPFTVTPAAENKLAVTTQPASPVAAGGTVTVGVTVEDQYGNTITTGTTGSNDTLHVALSSGGFAGGTTTVAATNGVASFSGLQINTAGTYTITASDSTTGSVTATATNSFTVNPAAENKLVVTTQPAGTITAGGTVTVGVTVEDQYGNTITTGNTGSNDTLHVALSSGGFASGTTSVAATNGVASFSGLQITSVAGSPYTITASDTTHGTVTSATTNNITVNPAAENKLAITTQPPAKIVNGTNFSVGVSVEDQYGNPITTGTGSSDTIHVALSSGSFASGTTSVAATNGVATFGNLNITTNGTYTITASDTSHAVTSATTASFKVEPPVTVSQSNSVNGTNGTQSVTLSGGTPSSGSTLLVLVYALGNFGTPAAPTISGNAVNGTPAQIQSVSPGGNYEGWAFTANASGSGTTVTATISGNVRDVELDVLSLAGNNTSSPVVQAITNTGTGTTPTATLTSAPAQGDLEVGFIVASGNHGGVGTTPSGWTLLEGNHGNLSGNRFYGGASYYTNTNGGTNQAFSLNTSVGWATIALDLGVA